MKRTSRKGAPRATEAGVDAGQIREMLRLTPTQRLRKAWRYGKLALEMQHAGGLRPSHS